ncbi:MSMEG_6728 family protein [Sandaracinus amylolyticus]|uniref:Cytoplasmic protein n=1 Tax=Sandaracinus amylolyticus TaxID=927083 RepID=A0A0F6YMU2_9BACT|nr:MSMEG_6728 family protein [Sandaracinus amylolyticus]AKF11091.1 hypothetical protein DB32_008240 [Sandaracinus amylolyticus]
MQTFLPYASFEESARCLDSLRLGKQRVEVLQILRASMLEDYGWQTHPVVCMWRGHEDALIAYGLAISDEWIRRGHRDTCLAQIAEFSTHRRPPTERELIERGAMPPWLGDEALHRSHRSALLRKHRDHYAPFFERDLPDDLPYVWPVPCAAPDTAREPIAAWVLRAETRAMLGRFVRDGVVALPDADAHSGTKSARMTRAFVEDAKIGDVILVPDEARLLVGEITSDARHERRRRRPHVRDVRWLGELDRRALRRPVRLQDPSLFFALRGEDDPRLAMTASASSARV